MINKRMFVGGKKIVLRVSPPKKIPTLSEKIILQTFLMVRLQTDRLSSLVPGRPPLNLRPRPPQLFFSEYGYRPHVAGVLRHRKRRFSNTLSRVETSSYRIRVDGRKRRFSNTMTSCLVNGSRLALRHMYTIRFGRHRFI